MAICVRAVVGEAPCQCFSPGENEITSPGRISSIGPPHRCARPVPNTTIRVCPRGCVCHAVRAPGSNVTLAPAARAEARCRELTADVERLSAAGEALEALESLVRRNR